MAQNIVILIPALNEELSIQNTIENIPCDAQIIVIDNGSIDKTRELALDSGARVLREVRKSYGYAYLRGINFAKNLDPKPDLIVFLDADGADDPKNITKLLELINKNYHLKLVMGSRLRNLEKNSMSTHAIIANKFLTKLINLLYRSNISDLGPLRIIDFDTLIEIDMQDTGYGWSSEMIVKLLKRGYKIKEVEVNYRPRLGTSKISGSFIVSLKAAIWLTIHIFRHFLFR